MYAMLWYECAGARTTNTQIYPTIALHKHQFGEYTSTEMDPFIDLFNLVSFFFLLALFYSSFAMFFFSRMSVDSISFRCEIEVRCVISTES